MRKLTVKNFSVIKEAELEFGKITVLIGPQSSGKSLLCKLAYFFRKVVVEQAENSMREARPLEAFRLRVMGEFSDVWFPPFGQELNAKVEYKDGSYGLILSRSSTTGRLTSGSAKAGLALSNEIESCYIRTWNELEREKNSSGNADFNSYARVIRTELERLQSSDAEVYSYIPSTRAFFVNTQKAILGTSNRIDPLTLRFSQDFSFDYQKRVPQVGLKHDLTAWIDQESRRLLNGEVVVRGNSEIFCAEDGRELPLSYLSSGTQELLPLMTCLREFVALSSAVAWTLDLQKSLHRRLFFVEEPEASIFPSSQNEIVRVFSRMANEPLLDASWVITTHSPYLLTSFGNLLKAGKVGASDAEHHAAVDQVVPEKYWINNSDFAAYKIEDGVLVGIFDKETGQIDGDYLDNVSSNIAEEFGNLLEIQYGK
jgi:hypothetical protein